MVEKNEEIKIDVTFIEGRGKAKSSLQDSFREINKQFNLKMFPGSLNLISRNPFYLKKSFCFYISNDRKRFFWRAKLNGENVLIYRWKKCPAHVFEIVSKNELRPTIENSDKVKLIIDEQMCSRGHRVFWRLLIWNALWKRRETKYYKDSFYSKIVRKWPMFKQLYKTSNGII